MVASDDSVKSMELYNISGSMMVMFVEFTI